MAAADNGNREREIFEAALDIASDEERLAYLKGASGEDAALLARVQALLKAHEAGEEFLPEQPREDAAMRLVTEKPGDHIGRYKLLQQIGEGGWGVVYLAEQEEPLRRRVALKVIKLGMDTKQVVARFEAERQALAMMDHPNIAKIFDAGVTGSQLSTPNSQLPQGRPYFVMELVRGIKITEYCDEHCLSTEERLNLFVQVCHAIQHAHQKGVIHRDIKPSNILVTINDGVAVPKVIDFGIAKAIGQQLTDKTVFTAFEQFIGTPAYVSPEQAAMTSVDIDTRSDIYALGVLLYELLTGHTPFEQQELIAAGLDHMRRIIREQEPARPSTRLSTLAAEEQTTVAKRRRSDPPQLLHLLRGDLDWIVMKCLEKERNRRYETANGLAGDIVRHVNNEAVSARPPSRLYRFERLVLRNRLLFMSGAAIVATLVLGLGFSLWALAQERRTRMRAVAAENQARAQVRKSEQVARFLEDMLRGVGPSVALGRDTAMLKEILDRTAERVGNDLKSEPEVEAELRTTIGGVYEALGEYQKAEAMYRLALKLRQELWGNLNTNVADSLDSLGWEFLIQDKIGAAEPLFQEALAIRTNLLGAENAKVATSLYHLGYVRLSQSPNPQAEPLLRQSLAMRRKFLGNENLEVAESLSALSTALNNELRREEAEAAAREALAIQARVLPDERSAADAGVTQLRLGLALLDQNKFAEAEPVVRQALSLRRNLLGSEHHNVAQALDVLAQVLTGEDKLAEAEAVAREGLVISRKTIGDQHFTTADLLTNLGITLRKAGRLVEAEAALREALDVWHQLSNLKEGSATWNGAWVWVTLATVLQQQGKLSELQALSGDEVDTARKSPEPGSLAIAFASVGNWFGNRGQPAEAEAAYREGLDICQKVSPDNVDARQRLAEAMASRLRIQRRLAEAEALYRETIEAGRRSNQTNALGYLLAGLGDVLRDQGKMAQAEPLYREGLDLCRSVATNDFALRQWLTAGLSGLLRSQAKLAEAESICHETLQVGRRLPSSPYLPRALTALADVFRDQGKFAAAESSYRESLEISRNLAANDFDLRQWPTFGLGGLLRTQGRFAEAEPIYRECLELCRKAAPGDLERGQWLALGLALSLQGQGKLAQAEPLYREALTNAIKVWPKDPAKWQSQIDGLVDVLQRQGKPDEADEVRREFLGQPGVTNTSEQFQRE